MIMSHLLNEKMEKHGQSTLTFSVERVTNCIATYELTGTHEYYNSSNFYYQKSIQLACLT